jgi:hypothetical protein
VNKKKNNTNNNTTIELSEREKEIIQYGLSLLREMLETARAIEVPLIQGTTLPTIEEVLALAKKIPLSKSRNNKNGL